jgi:hypothetical protein
MVTLGRAFGRTYDRVRFAQVRFRGVKLADGRARATECNEEKA